MRHTRPPRTSASRPSRSDYFFVRIADLMSLAFCARWSETTDGTEWRGYTVRRNGDDVLISPDPFSGVRVRLEIDAREILNSTLPRPRRRQRRRFLTAVR